MRHTSLCITSFNRPQFLPACIDSLHVAAKHDGIPVEIIVYDDGSHDPALRQWLWDAHGAGRISLLMMNSPGHNEGRGVAMNRMFAAATGDPICVIDHDLTFKADWLSKARAILEADQMVGLLGLFKYHMEPVDHRKTRTSRIFVDEQGDIPPYAYHTHLCGSAMVIRRSCFEWLGPFEERSDAFAEDWAFQNKVTESERFKCALPEEDLVVNHGFGVGPSSVVVAPGVVQKIHHGPRIYGV